MANKEQRGNKEKRKRKKEKPKAVPQISPFAAALKGPCRQKDVDLVASPKRAVVPARHL
jgi:hypothetical protein